MKTGLVDLWHAMGPLARGVVLLLVAMSVLGVAIAIDRWIALRRLRRSARRHSEALGPILASGKIEEAATIPEDGSISRVVIAGLREYLDVRSRAPSASEALVAVETAMERTTDQELLRLRRGLGALATIGSTAPFVGLFGTIVGIVNAFREIAHTGAGGLGVVSAGIAEALVTTAMGIAVAVVAVALWNALTGGIETAEAEISDAAAGLVGDLRKADWREEAR